MQSVKLSPSSSFTGEERKQKPEFLLINVKQPTTLRSELTTEKWHATNNKKPIQLTQQTIQRRAQPDLLIDQIKTCIHMSSCGIEMRSEPI